MRNVALLGTRLVLGGYLAVHGAQKLFGAFGGHGLDVDPNDVRQPGPPWRLKVLYAISPKEGTGAGSR